MSIGKILGGYTGRAGTEKMLGKDREALRRVFLGYSILQAKTTIEAVKKLGLSDDDGGEERLEACIGELEDLSVTGVSQT